MLSGTKVSVYFSKRISKEHYLLVCSRWENGVLFIDLSFKLPHTFIEDIKTVEPFDILPHFVRKFGMAIRLGLEEKKLWVFESLLLPPGQQLPKIIEIVNPNNTPFIQCMLFSIHAIANTRIAECSLVFCIDKEGYKSWLFNSTDTSGSIPEARMLPTRESGTKYYELQKNILDQFFGKDWFLATNLKTHPAYIRWMLCNKMITQNAVIHFPHQKEEIATLGQIALDCAVLATITKGDVQGLKLGSLTLYGDDAVQKSEE